MSSIIGLKKANCKNCYKCLKVCPVKAIKFENEQAKIIGAACILCGRCLSECPQNAKTLTSDLLKVKTMLKEGKKVLVSLAPSFQGSFACSEPGRLVSAIKQLGFYGVSETSEGAAYVTAEYHRLMKEGKQTNIITTCCPSINRLAEFYYPGVVDSLAPVVSPMLAHARLLKQRFGKDVKVVFAGPCIAKKDEAADIRHDGDVDAVLTFDDLDEWMKEQGIAVENCEPEDFLNGSSKILRMYPVTDGILESLRVYGEQEGYQLLSVDGVEECRELFDAIESGELKNCFIEVNACKGGCVNGPAKVGDGTTRFAARVKVEQYARSDADTYPELEEGIALSNKFFDRSGREALPDEETIRAILKKIGKDTPEQELNCGSCGYPSCRDKAIAVFQNRAELTMCMPYMRSRAESLSNYVLSETPNITLIVDSDLNIIEFNTAAEKAFGVTRTEALQKSLYELFDVSDFQFVFETKQSITDKKVHYKEYNITTLQSIVYIEEENIAMGLFKDITSEEQSLEKQYKMRVETMEMAQKVIDKQMIAAQEIAHLLGETTAETKVTLTKLKDMIVFDGDEQ